MVLLSSLYLPVDAIPNPLNIPINWSRLSCSRSSPVLAFEINRVAGLVWTGRPLLFVRSVVALCLLSTAHLELRQLGSLGFMTAFEANLMDATKLVLASGEVAW
ncbi:Aste57867_16218 [Aphanomyces stellatus]|uniref:Aste57867_16218 protein n=1 Tax=Aphanomyces stellatus TaxID=120398 RepID=A0A485L5Z0_9STRA|nr:hypothetical protein As57867_016161 [Aphanomyces stellatus]VFT92996.1 Aste57867_16218 [Aphanomyces stellatus]